VCGSFEAQLHTWRVRASLATAVCLAAAWVGVVSAYGPPADLARRAWQWARGAERIPTTGASFSVSAGTFTSETRGASFAAALHVAGLPTLLRVRPDDGRYQVLVGPYVSTEEAERAQRALAAWRMGDTRLVVDDSLRGAGDPGRHSFLLDEDPARRINVMLVAALGSASLVFELPRAPRGVELRYLTTTTLALDVQSFADPRPEVLSASVATVSADPEPPWPMWETPANVLLLKQLFVSFGTGDRVGARLVVPDGVRSRVRLEGRRVYVDLAWPKAPWEFDEVPVSSTPRVAAAAPADQHTPESAYAARVTDVESRVAEMRPFLEAAVKAPAPDVLEALQRAVVAVSRTLHATEPPASRRAAHTQMVSALETINRAIDPESGIDRPRALREGLNTFDGALGQVAQPLAVVPLRAAAR
jgi:hypothetical protein